jgi:phosphopantothenoylcysteine decarboxylase/phosphopantothenate--cysteine ligase
MKKKKILLIITGSIAAYKAMDLARILIKNSFDVTCVLTKGAQQFITPLLATSLTQNKTYTDLFSSDDEAQMGHIQLSRKNDLIVIAPASADFIAKIAQGRADDLASSIILAANKKIFLAPAMNEKMWQNKKTQSNLSELKERKIALISPENDLLACGETGFGKMAAPEKIAAKINDFFQNQNLLKGKKIVITGGSTIEKIDEVRFISNHSSGLQAALIAGALDEMGADVTFIAGNLQVEIPLKKEKIIKAISADEMLKAAQKNLKNCDVFIACAAVADFKAKQIVKGKIKKNSSNEMALQLIKNPDILAEISTSKNRPKMVIGFAAESENLEKYGHEKLEKKNCDLIVANHIKGGEIFGSNATNGFFISKKSSEKFNFSKEELAKELAQKIKNFLSHQQNK